jgi:hypothetical protein
MTTKLQKREKEYQLKQENEIKSHSKWDKKSIFILIAISSVLISIIVLDSIDVKSIFLQKNQNWDTTVGAILSLEEVRTMDQTLAGNRTSIIQYRIQCSYIVSQTEYKQEIIHINDRAINRFLAWIKYPKNKEIEIFYKKDNPANSCINTNINSEFYKNKR